MLHQSGERTLAHRIVPRCVTWTVLAMMTLAFCPFARAAITKEEVLRQMRPSTGIEEVPPSPWYVLAKYGAWLGVGLTAFALAMIIRSRFRPRPGQAPSVSADVRALRDLERIEGLGLVGQGRYDQFCTELSNVVRRYVEQRFRLPATKQTTPEFLASTREANLLTADQRETLREFLETCDLAKFAGVGQGIVQCQSLMDVARRFIEKTK